MTTNTLWSDYSSVYSFESITDEIRSLLELGTVNRRQPLYTLANHICDREWSLVEMQLEEKGYLLRDRIGEVFAIERWDND